MNYANFPGLKRLTQRDDKGGTVYSRNGDNISNLCRKLKIQLSSNVNVKKIS